MVSEQSAGFEPPRLVLRLRERWMERLRPPRGLRKGMLGVRLGQMRRFERDLRVFEKRWVKQQRIRLQPTEKDSFEIPVATTG